MVKPNLKLSNNNICNICAALWNINLSRKFNKSLIKPNFTQPTKTWNFCIRHFESLKLRPHDEVQEKFLCQWRICTIFLGRLLPALHPSSSCSKSVTLQQSFWVTFQTSPLALHYHAFWICYSKGKELAYFVMKLS